MISDEALLERLLDGDMKAFEALYGRYERRLFGFILGQLRDQQEAEDVLHETFMALLREARHGNRSQSCRAWLYAVARHLCLNRARTRRRATRALSAVSGEPVAAPIHPERALVDRELTEALRQAVERLPASLSELYHLRAAGLSYDELADVLQVPMGTVKSRMHQMVGRLREEMSG